MIEENAILAAAGVIVLLAGAASGLYVLLVKPIRKLTQIGAMIEEVRDDWFGVEERPGVPGRPGVMVRLQTIEEQLRPNAGKSVRDVLDRVERGQLRLEDSLAAHFNEHRLAAAERRAGTRETSEPEDGGHVT